MGFSSLKNNRAVLAAISKRSFWLCGAVAQKVRDLGKEFPELVAGLVRDLGFHHGLVHQLQPAVTLELADTKRGVPHPQSRMAALLDIGVGTTQAENEKIAQTLLGSFPVIVRIHGANDLIYAHPFVECGYHFGDAWTLRFADRCRPPRYLSFFSTGFDSMVTNPSPMVADWIVS